MLLTLLDRALPTWPCDPCRESADTDRENMCGTGINAVLRYSSHKAVT